MLHRDEIERASGGYDDFFLLTDRENASRINRQRSSYQVGGALNGVYRIYGAGAPFERLFFETRQQLDDTTRQLAYERKEREFEKALDPRYDDYNFFEGYLQLQHAVLDYDNRMFKMRKEFSAKRRRERERDAARAELDQMRADLQVGGWMREWVVKDNPRIHGRQTKGDEGGGPEKSVASVREG